MLDATLKKTIQNNYSLFLNSKNLTARYGQKLMIAEIAKSLSDLNSESMVDDKILIIEAGTGTGKTLAYLLAAIPIAKHKKKKLILSTATIALQEQIIFKDLPDILRQTELEFTFSLAKGRKRYVCLNLLMQYLSNGNTKQTSLSLDDLSENKSITVNTKLYQSLFDKFQKKQWNGEREDWPKVIDYRDWFNITSDPAQCTGRRCPQYPQCVLYKARERIFKTDVIVANHDLVLSDLSMGGGFILPAPEETIYIFDEGHHLPDKAISHFSYNIQLQSTGHWLNQLYNTLNKFESSKQYPDYIKNIISKLPDLNKQYTQYAHDLLKTLESNLSFIDQKNSKEIKQSYRFADGLFPEAYHSLTQSLHQILGHLYQNFEPILTYFSQINDEAEETATDNERLNYQNMLKHMQTALSRVEGSQLLFQYYTAGKLQESSSLENKPKNKNLLPPIAKWINKVSVENANTPASIDMQLCCSPILPDQELKQLIWDPCFASIITSATIAVNKDFSLFQRYTGIHGNCQQIPSHFDYNKQVTFYIPSMEVDPSQDIDAHTLEIVSYLDKYLDDTKGNLVLFSSNKQLNDIEYYLLKKDPKWQSLILAQGKNNKQEIINQHKKRIDQHMGSVIFGLASFAEGVDLPGNYCTSVFITKLPFSVPDHPIDETLNEWLEKQGRNPFMEITVPQATIKLIQACGRLIRQESDSGTITLLDTRILSKRYGQLMFNALPNYNYKLNQYPSLLD
ncbi:MAG: ATP-dependent DNA helicase DinG [Gammaproteobacteria bacterium]|nr:ATP-dependent DNA helicase DinG [Gammaproteobacteria bacterium]